MTIGSERRATHGRACADRDLAGQVRSAGDPVAAVRLLTFNVEMNPKSNSAKRQHAAGVIAMAFQQSGSDSVAAAYRALRTSYGDKLVGEPLLNDVGYQLLFSGAGDAALLAFRFNAAEHPQSGNAFDSLGEALASRGRKQDAINAYTKAVQLDPANENARARLSELTRGK